MLNHQKQNTQWLFVRDRIRTYTGYSSVTTKLKSIFEKNKTKIVITRGVEPGSLARLFLTPSHQCYSLQSFRFKDLNTSLLISCCTLFSVCNIVRSGYSSATGCVEKRVEGCVLTQVRTKETRVRFDRGLVHDIIRGHTHSQSANSF